MKFFSKKKKETQEINTCEVKNLMDNAMSIQGKAMVNQVEMNIAYQVYTLYRYKEEMAEDDAIKRAGQFAVKLRNSLLNANEEFSI